MKISKKQIYFVIAIIFLFIISAWTSPIINDPKLRVFHLIGITIVGFAIGRIWRELEK